VVGREVHTLPHSAIALEIQRDLVLPGRRVQPLEDAVEVVDDARVEVVDVDLGFLRFHFETDVGDRITIAIRERWRIRVGIRPPPGIVKAAPPIRVRGVYTAHHDDAAAAELRIGAYRGAERNGDGDRADQPEAFGHDDSSSARRAGTLPLWYLSNGSASE